MMHSSYHMHTVTQQFQTLLHASLHTLQAQRRKPAPHFVLTEALPLREMTSL